MRNNLSDLSNMTRIYFGKIAYIAQNHAHRK